MHAVLAIYRDLGVSVPDPDAPQFTDDDVALISRLSWADRNGFSTGPGGPAMLRVVASAIERIAEASVAVYVQGPQEEMRRRHAGALEHTQKKCRGHRARDEARRGAGSAVPPPHASGDRPATGDPERREPARAGPARHRLPRPRGIDNAAGRPRPG